MARRLAISAALASILTLTTSAASAYVLKHAGTGATVRWRADSVAFVLQDSLAAVKGASTAASAAATAWSGRAGAPRAKAAAGVAPAVPTVDGKSVVLRSESFEPSGSALAVTVLTYDETTGEVLDADIVLNAKHALELLPRAKAVSAGNVDGAEDEEEPTSKNAHGLLGDGSRYDLSWVLAHEMGHALGLGDDPDAPDALMYPFVKADLAGPNEPTSADIDGLEVLYEPEPSAPSSSRSGCVRAAVAPSDPHDAVAIGAVTALALVLARRRLVIRRRKRLLL